MNTQLDHQTFFDTFLDELGKDVTEKSQHISYDFAAIV